jgi:NhaC family Na+:H+ antiporter
MEKARMREPGLLEALIPIIFLIAILATNVYIFDNFSEDNVEGSALDGAHQIGLLLSATLAGIISLRLGVPWSKILSSAVHRISSAMGSILILLLIGALAGTWLLSGIVPAMVYYGLDILSPGIFLFAACLVCSVVSIATGSSWTTIATVGVALLVIGKALGFSEGIIGGAIISGAYFGDKMSPLSDTTNLAPAMAGTDLFTHIRYMALTTVPSILITLVIFLFIGFFNENSVSVDDIAIVQEAIHTRFNTSGWLMLVPLAVFIMIIRRMPALPALLIGALLGGVFAIIFQPHIVEEVAGYEGTWLGMSYVGVMRAMYGQISITTDNAMVNDLLSTSGMFGMMNTVWLILSAMVFGGMMEAGGLLKKVAEVILKAAYSTGSLIASTVGTCIFFNVTSSDQYMAIVVPGRMFAETYKKRKLAPENLSRTLEDSGTVTSVLVPWNTCGFTQATVLGVATMVYAPFCFFNIISPFMTMLYGYLGIKIRKLEEETLKNEKEEAVEVS